MAFGTIGPSRRRVIAGGASLVALGAGGQLAAALIPTPPQTEGPFYPPEPPLGSDNDLVQVAGRAERAAGTVLHLDGRVLDAAGREVADARVEIWQADARGRYHHPAARGDADPNFQGFGRTTTRADGRYRFRTIRPVAYPGRTPHIHFRVAAPGFGAMTTQMYVEGEPLNRTDPILNRIRDEAARASLVVPLVDAEAIEAGALRCSFDIVLGHNAVAPA
ncbi:MAG: intradiol ring-cleavage dioxygenase [Alphaproteobacteria bacterium]